MWYSFAKTNWVQYEEARRWGILHEIKSQREWISARKPTNIPMYPDRVYRDEWLGWEVFLTPFEDPRNKIFNNNKPRFQTDFKTEKGFYGQSPPAYQKIIAPYEDAQLWAKNHNIRSLKEWQESNLPMNMPKNPRAAYPEKFTDWEEFFMIPKEKNKARRHPLPYEKAKQYIREHGIKNLRDYENYKRKYKTPFLPSNLATYYAGLYSPKDFFEELTPGQQQRINNPPPAQTSSSNVIKKWVFENNIQNFEDYLLRKPENFPDVLPSWLTENVFGWSLPQTVVASFNLYKFQG